MLKLQAASPAFQGASWIALNGSGWRTSETASSLTVVMLGPKPATDPEAEAVTVVIVSAATGNKQKVQRPSG